MCCVAKCGVLIAMVLDCDSWRRAVGQLLCVARQKRDNKINGLWSLSGGNRSREGSLVFFTGEVSLVLCM